MKSIMTVAAAMLALQSGPGNDGAWNTGRVPVRIPRDKTPTDTQQMKTRFRNMKRGNDYFRCLNNNPCLRA